MTSKTFGISFAFTGMKEKSDNIKLAICDNNVRENSAIQKRLRSEKNLSRAISKQNRLWQKISSVDLRTERVQRALSHRSERLEQVEKFVEEKKCYRERLQRQERVLRELEEELQRLRQYTKQIEQKTKEAVDMISEKRIKLEEARSRAANADEIYRNLKEEHKKATKDLKVIKRRSGECNSPSGIENRLKGKIKFMTQRCATFEEKESVLEEEIIMKEDKISDLRARRLRVEDRIKEYEG